ncbi:MAG: ABC transporter permease [Gemmatimonadota bacterium]
MFLYDLKHAVRRLVREPGFTFAAVLTLALGVGANVAVFAVVEAVLLRPLPYVAADRLVVLNHRDQRTGLTKPDIAIGDYIDMAARQTTFEAFGGYGSTQATIYGPAEPYRVAMLVATSGALDALGMRPLLGRGVRPEDSHQGAAPVLVLGYDLWQRRFGGDSSVVGQSIKIDNERRQVVGVAPRGFVFPPNAGTDVIASMTVPSEAPSQRKLFWTLAVGKVKQGRSVADAAADLATMSRRMETDHPASNQSSRYFAVPLRDALVGNTKQALVLLLAAVGVVLLIACANVANLLLARSLARRREMAVRIAVGAGRGRLAAQLLTESSVLAVVAGLVGILIAHWGTRGLVALVPQSVTVPGLADVRLSGAVLGFSLGLTMLTALGFGIMAALTVRLETVGNTLVGAGRTSISGRARRAMGGLVVAEIAFAVVLLIGAGLILRTFAGLVAVDPGFQSENVLTTELTIPFDRYATNEAREGFYASAFAALRAIPQVKEVGAAVIVPLTGNNWSVPFERTDQPVAAGERPPDVGWQVASGGFFKALGIPLVAGRLFGERDRQGGAPAVIVSDALEKRFFGTESAVGHQIKLGKDRAEIVGVVGSIRRASLSDEPRADLYFPFESSPSPQITLFIKTAVDPALETTAVQQAIRRIEPNALFAATRSMADVADESVKVTKLVLWLLGIFAVTALVLAAVGIYGIMAYVVRQQTKEIGTRIALGALRSDILRLVLKDGARIAVAGATLGVVVGLAAARSLGSILYGVSASDPVILVAAALVLISVTMVACWVPARRAASVDPVKTLNDQ